MGNLEEYNSFSVFEGSDSKLENPSVPDERTTSNTLNPYPGVVYLFKSYPIGIGTGFFIRPNMLVTAAHVATEELLFFIDPSTGIVLIKVLIKNTI